MDQQQIDARQAEALQAVLEAAHDPVVAVVETVLEFQSAAPEAVLEVLRVVERAEQPADLGGQHIVGAWTAIQRAAEAMLALPAAVPRRRVVVADAGVPRGLQRGAGISVLDHVEQVAQPGAAEAELRELDVGAAKFAAGERVHGGLASDPGTARPVFPGSRVARAGFPHLSDFPFAEVDDVSAHSHRLGLDLRIDLQVNGRVHRVLDRDPGDRRAVTAHQHDTVRAEPVREIVAMRRCCHQ